MAECLTNLQWELDHFDWVAKCRDRLEDISDQEVEHILLTCEFTTT
jgi:hypothetical protein